MRAALECAHKGWANPSSSASPREAKKSRRDRFNSSPGECGEAPPSEAINQRVDVPKLIEILRRENDVGRVRDASDEV